MSRSSKASLLAALFALALLVPTGPPALAALDHSVVEDKFPVEGPCVKATDIVVHEEDELVYVSCQTSLQAAGFQKDVIRRFDYAGNPVPFTGTGSHIEDNELKADPGSFTGGFIREAELAVDNSGGPNDGYLYATSAEHLDVFRPNGEFIQSIFQPYEQCCLPNELNGVDVDENGFIYLTSKRPGSRVSKYNVAFNEVKRLYKGPDFADGLESFHHIRINSKGSLWGAWQTPNGATRFLDKYEADQFTDELEPGPFTIPPLGLERFYAKTSPLYSSPLISGPTGSIRRFDVDLNDDDLYVNRGDRIEIFSTGKADEFSYRNAPPVGVGVLNDSQAVAVTRDNTLFASTQGPEGVEIVRFGPGNNLPDVHTFAPEIDDVGHTSVMVEGEIERAGGSPIIRCDIEYGLTTSYSLPPVPCNPDPSSAPPGSYFSSDTQVSAMLSGLTTASTYHYTINAENEEGENWGIDRTATPSHVLKVRTLLATEVEPNGATLNASFDPDGLATSYLFQWGPTPSFGFETPAGSGGSGTGTVNVSSDVENLPSGRTFHYRVVATNSNGTTVGPTLTFRTASPPDVEGIRSSEVGPSSALLHATINPVGFATKYHFEYGVTSDYGQVAPAESVAVGSETEPLEVTQELQGLKPGVTYHYQVVAENKWGIATSDDTTFDYSPPSCPNDYQRQLSLGSFLPDCRAYELVSPGAAGSVIFFPSSVFFDNVQEFVPYGECCGSGFSLIYPVNSGRATAPSRFMFGGGYGSVTGLDGTVRPQDMYMGTRTASGWETTIPGLTGTKAFEAGRKECTDDLSLCIDHIELQSDGVYGFEESFAPYLYTAGGRFLGRLPTNLGVIPGGKGFRGAQRLSGSGDVYVFSSQSYGSSPAVAFAPDGSTAPFGSAYSNDINDRTVEVISKLPNGSDIPEGTPRPASWKAFDFPGLSTDGSHVLMSTHAGGGTIAGGDLLNLYMRVNGAVTYDITQGAPAEFVGMTRDGSEVLFITSSKLTLDDTDTSKDLYRWKEDGSVAGSLTRISQGNGKGNSDACSPSWGSKCDIARVAPEKWHPNKNRLLSAPGQDDIIADESGDVYFYSPEVLDGSRQGLINERNLYVYRNGTVRLVAALDANEPIKRMQISGDGRHAAFVTASRLTPYDNKSFDQVYAYNAETRVVRCASCIPTGKAPKEDAYASQGGRFMADDGRTFFATEESLVPRDLNGNKIDVYEYVGGRPQLITTGLASRDVTGGGDVESLISPPVGDIGLEHVSRDGVDVYFSTFESILPEDRNGLFIKFYNARTGGGFPRDVQLAPCVAADECHGPGSLRKPARTVNSETSLGAGGNLSEGPTTRRCPSGKTRRGNHCISKRTLRKRSRARAQRRRHATHGNGGRTK